MCVLALFQVGGWQGGCSVVAFICVFLACFRCGGWQDGCSVVALFVCYWLFSGVDDKMAVV